MSKSAPFSKYHSHSQYYAPCKGQLTHMFNQQNAGLRAQHYHHLMRATIESPAFPCVGAKAALKKESYRFGAYGKITDKDSFHGLCHDLSYFAQEQKEMHGDFTTFIACFDQPNDVFQDALDFEDQTWQMLGKLHDVDTSHYDYDVLASANPSDDHFAFSFAGTAYFVAALSPVSPRLSRRFVTPAYVFNAHYQFEAMKKKGKFEKLRDVIRHNDAALEGHKPNDIAADFGDVSEAIQYCGVRAKPAPKSQCPYHKYYR